MLLRRPLVPLMQLFQLFRVVLDVAPRAARSAPRRHSLSRKRLQTQPLRKAKRLLLRIELLDLRWCERMAPPRVPTRGSVAVPSAALGATRRGGGGYAHT